MSVNKFRFKSPGVFLREIDNSQLPTIPTGIGPVIIGRFRRGPAMKPVTVGSPSRLREIFGSPMPGNEGTSDAWRQGTGLQATSPATFAARTYFNNAYGQGLQPPVNIIRLLGIQADNAGEKGIAGWSLGAKGNSYGLFVIPTSSTTPEAQLMGIVYATDDDFKIGVYGTDANGGVVSPTGNLVSSSSDRSEPVKILNDRFALKIETSTGSENVIASFLPAAQIDNKDQVVFIRDAINTNPAATNDGISHTLKDYWLGETFEESYSRLIKEHTNSQMYIFVAKLHEDFEDFSGLGHQMTAAKTGWVIPQNFGTTGSFAPENAEKLFRLVSLQDGEDGNRYYARIQNIKIQEETSIDPFSKFDIVICRKGVTQASTELRTFADVDLNPNSQNYIAKVLGDQYFEWDSVSKRNRVYNSNPVTNEWVRVEMHPKVEASGLTNKRSAPFGFLGPIQPADITGLSPNANIISSADKWIDGGVDLSNFNAVVSNMSFKWPTCPHVLTGTLGNNNNYHFGATWKGLDNQFVEMPNNVLEPEDYYRRFPADTSYLTDQDSGIAGAESKHSYVFSLDEIVIKGNNVPGENLNQFEPTSVEFVPGSQGGTVAVQGVNAAPATSTITLTTDNGAENAAAIIGALNTKSFTLIDALGVSVSFVFTDDHSDADGREVISSGVNKVVIGINGAAMDQIADRIVAAINSLDGGEMPNNVGGRKRDLDITAADDATADENGWTITLTQGTNGLSGNGSMPQDADLLNLNGNANADFVVADFVNGADAVQAVAGIEAAAYTAQTGSGFTAKSLVDLVDCFTMPFAGGFDGVDVTEADPFNMSDRAIGDNSTPRTSYAHASVSRAIEMIAEPEMIEHKIAVMPGITNKTLTDKLIQVCEARGDSLAIIDLPDVYKPPYQEKCNNFQERIEDASPRKMATALRKRQINSSYACTYYPWVKASVSPGDEMGGPREVWLPPSVVALAAMSYTDAANKPWFAPAGFTRGGLNRSTIGLNVNGVTEQLLVKDRDILYEANINPIANFGTEGIVIFGQKTLQQTRSALDRINVRRLLIFVKKEVSRVCNNLLFDQNVPATWNRFKSRVVPFLEEVQTELGLSDFKVILDKTTTTPDLVDRNVMYAKIFLKPARSIEFIAVDFVITRSGVDFGDI